MEQEENKEEKIIEIKSLASTGSGSGFSQEKGLKVPYFIPFTCPGDKVSIKEAKKHKKYVEAELKEIVEPSEFRSKKKCRHYQICGGCNLLHIEYKKQVEFKKTILEFLFKRNNLEFNEIEAIESKNPYNYRYKSKVFFEYKDGSLICGFNEKYSNDAVKVEECHIVHRKILNAIKSINNANLQIKKRFIGIFTLNHKDNSLALRLISDKLPILEKFLAGIVDEIYYEEQKKIFTYKIGDKTLFYTGDSFIQANLDTNPLIIELIEDYIKKNVKDAKEKILLDLYAGIGNLSIPLCDLFKDTIIVEGQRESFDMLIKSLEHNKITEAEGFNDDILHFLEYNDESFDIVILDPPRTGTENGVIEEITAIKPELIIYVSCSPETCVKEIKVITERGYKIKKVALIDMFPNTNHMEFITFLQKS